MTKREFVDKYKHEFAGYVYDALSTNARGALLSETMALIMGKIKTNLEQAWGDLQPKPEQSLTTIPITKGKP